MLLAGCAIGPKTLPFFRQSYNTALERSNNEQLLLNIVRLAYGDTPYFLNVDNIAAQLEFQTNINAEFEHNNKSDKPNGLFLQ